MDVQCARTFLQEMPIGVANSCRLVSQAVNSFIMCFHGMEESELSIIFRSAAQHFEGRRNLADLFWIGRRDVPGSWVQTSDVATVNCFVGILQFSHPMPDRCHFTRYMQTWI